MKIQLVGGQYHGECQILEPYREIIQLAVIRGQTVELQGSQEEWFPLERYQNQIYCDTLKDTVVAGERRRVFVYTGK